MSAPTAVQPETSGRTGDVVVNDFSISVATVNGTGSQSANNTLIRAIKRMGVPVSGKNIFPSNIQGLPTWFDIRVSEAGWVSRRRRADVLVCMNAESARQDVMKAAPGAVVVADESMPLKGLRDDATVYPVPFNRIVAECCPNPKLRRLVINMIYVGVVAELLSIEMEAVEGALGRMFRRKPKAVEQNMAAVRAGAEYAREHFSDRPKFRVERRDLIGDRILIDGNTAAAIGALMAGCTVLPWYPITPSSSLAEALARYLARYRKDADGKATYAVVQAEDELAAAGMVLGAGWAGARAITATSGPGISLMTEFIGLGYYAEIPGVFADVQRTGPSTGLPTRTMQGDVLLAAYSSHGDCKHPVYFPASPQEAYEFMIQAFDLAERFQTPVFFLTDLDLGMNNWLCEPFPYPTTPLDRGKVLDEEKLRAIGVETWGRYKDLDGDGIPWRTLPGLEMDGAAYFTRGSGHDEYARYTESSETYVRNMDRLARKFETLRPSMPAPVSSNCEGGSRVGVLAYGTTHWALIESREQLREEHGITFDYLRVRGFPFSDDVKAFFDSHDRVYVVEQNRDSQLATLIRAEVLGTASKIRPILHYDGMPIDARSVTEKIAAAERG